MTALQLVDRLSRRCRRALGAAARGPAAALRARRWRSAPATRARLPRARSRCCSRSIAITHLALGRGVPRRARDRAARATARTASPAARERLRLFLFGLAGGSLVPAVVLLADLHGRAHRRAAQLPDARLRDLPGRHRLRDRAPRSLRRRPHDPAHRRLRRRDRRHRAHLHGAARARRLRRAARPVRVAGRPRAGDDDPGRRSSIPLRGRIQALVDLVFFRAPYDYRTHRHGGEPGARVDPRPRRAGGAPGAHHHRADAGRARRGVARDDATARRSAREGAPAPALARRLAARRATSRRTRHRPLHVALGLMGGRVAVDGARPS